MKKIFIILLVLITNSTMAQTMVSGVMTESSKWNAKNSPYIIESSVLIPDNITLIIEPGTTVKFNESTRMVIKGELIAKGESNSKIIFTSNLVNPKPSDWEGIIFKNESIDATLDEEKKYISGSIIEFAIIEYAGDKNYDSNIGGAIRIEDSSPYISYNILRNNKFTYHYEDGGAIAIKYDSNPIITYNYITNNQAVTGGGIMILRAGGSITNNYILDNNGSRKGGGIYIWGTNDKLLIQDNLIKLNKSEKGGAIFIRSTKDMDVFTGNSFIDNTGFEIYRESLDDISLNFKNNFWNTTEESQISNKIFDFYDDFENGIVEFSDYLTENDISIYNPYESLNTNITSINEFKIFPNPTLNIININSKLKVEKIRIYDTKGVLLKTSNVQSNKMNLEKLNKGTYVVEFLFRDYCIVRKIVKK